MRRSSLLVLTAVGGVVLLSTPALAGGKRPAADTTPPTVAISSASATRAAGSAADGTSVARVDVAVDGGAWQAATGTTSWSAPLALPAGSHTVVARATDGSGNTATTSTTVSVAAKDTTAPTLTISTPTDAAVVSGSTSVTGTAADDTQVSAVSVSLDGGAWQTATGTTSWSTALSVTGPGSHTITARAVDSAGNATTATRTVSVAATSSGNVLADPSAANGLSLLGRGRAASWGDTTALVYWEESTAHRGVALRAGGTTTYVALPAGNGTGWSNLAYTLTSASDLWVLGGTGPLTLRHFTLAGAATLVSEESVGDSDSRMGDVVRLASGALVLAWHQQGASGPQGQYLSYRKGTTSQTLGPLTFVPTKASKQVLVQHPADASIWLFCSPDAWGAVAAAHLTESVSGLTVDWSDAKEISTSAYGEMGPDPENPDIEAEPDPATGTVVLAYQGAHRQIFQTSPSVVTGAYPVVARVTATGSWSFAQLPTYVERISSLGLTVSGGDVRLLYRPIDTTSMTFTGLSTTVLHAGTWQGTQSLGQLWTSYERISSAPTGDLAAVRMSDGLVHLLP